MMQKKAAESRLDTRDSVTDNDNKDEDVINDIDSCLLSVLERTKNAVMRKNTIRMSLVPSMHDTGFRNLVKKYDFYAR